jgi:hypothetical protein
MKRKLFVLAVLVGISAFSLADRPLSASFPLCGPPYCPGHPNNLCTCPPGTKRAGQTSICGTWRPDCNAL